MSECPKITVVTPSYNQVQFLELTIRSVLDQNYPNLEYIIIDGGSTDGSVDIIKKYAGSLAYWVSEPDKGQVDAINKGLRVATGEWVAWQNSDDIYYPGSFESFAQACSQNHDADVIVGDMNLIDENGQVLRDLCYVTPTYNSLRAEGMVLANQAAFWRRRIHEDVGLLSNKYECSFDYEWFLRVLKGRKAYHVNQKWGGFRLHENAKTSMITTVFADENRMILDGREVSPVVRAGFMLRRMFLTLMNGNVSYVIRGVLTRTQVKGRKT
jgi:glycosyltransferase involved in cell wall biosynthesis